MNTTPLRLAVLISGGGRTLKNLIDLSAAGKLPIEICLVLASRGKAGGLDFARHAELPIVVARRSEAASDEQYGMHVFDPCREAGVDYVAMAGFMKFVPIPSDFENRVVNIHPALLPAFGGQGMFGDRVHQAVLEYGARISGCTVHFADNQYDHGPIIYQQVVPVLDDDTPQRLAARVFEAEKEAYPYVLRGLAEKRIVVEGRQVRWQ